MKLPLLVLLCWCAVGQELLVCGDAEVFILNITRSSQPPEKLFSWKATDGDDMPPEFRGLFRTTDECKPLPGGRILVTASSDGVAVVERESGRTPFWARVPDAHSAELLPGNKLVVASSTHKEGNRLVLFDLAVPAKPLSSVALNSAHGVVWDETRQRLWALGYTELVSYRLVEGTPPRLEAAETFPLPDPGGHDLYAHEGARLLGLTTGKSALLFDRDKKKFSPHFGIPWAENVKSISIHPKTKQVVYVQAELPAWWSSKLKFLRPANEVELPGERLYKARWVK